MLIHIILGILKMIGILLLILLALALLLLVSLLIVPVRYYADAHRDTEGYEGRIRISWLFHLVYVSCRYGSHTEGMKMSIRLFGIPLDLVMEKISGMRKRRKKKSELTTAQQQEDKPEVGEQGKSVEESLLGQQKNSSEEQAEKGRKKEKEQKKQKKQGVIYKLRQIIQKILQIPEKTKRAFRNLRLTAQQICDKIRQMQELLSSDSFLGAKTLIFGELRTVFNHLRPRTIKGNVIFGFGDPSTTGYVLAAASALYPFYGSDMTLCPCFDRTVLEGDLEIKGRMYGIMFVRTAWRFFRNPDIKDVVGKFRN